jgi:hypothetical protein
MNCSRVWSGSSWSANTNTTYDYADFGNDNNTGPSQGFNAGNATAYINGGTSGTGTSVSSSSKFNGSTWASDTASSTARSGSSGGVF